MTIRSEIYGIGIANHNPTSPEDRDWFISTWEMRYGVGVSMYDPDKGKVSGWPYRELMIIAEVNRIAGYAAAIELAEFLREQDKVAHEAVEDKINALRQQIKTLEENL